MQGGMGSRAFIWLARCSGTSRENWIEPLIRATQPGLVSPGGSEPAQRYSDTTRRAFHESPEKVFAMLSPCKCQTSSINKQHTLSMSAVPSVW